MAQTLNTIPNLLTYGRILAVPLFVVIFLFPGDFFRWVCLAIFIVAAITDFFDGYLARIWQQYSELGRMLDPIADKLLVAAVLFMLTGDQTLSGFHLIAGVIILSREILVSGLREFLAERQVSVPVSKLAKWKTTIQLIALGFLIAGPAGDAIIPYVTQTGLFLLWIAAFFTLITGYDYVRGGYAHIAD